MTTLQTAVQTLPGRRQPTPPPTLAFLSRSIGTVSDTTLTPREGTFNVKLQVPLVHMSSLLEPGVVMPIQVQDEAGHFLLIWPDGPGAAPYAALDTLVRSTGLAGAMIYFAARWLPPEGGGNGGCGSNGSAATPTILRLDTSKPLAPPSPIW